MAYISFCGFFTDLSEKWRKKLSDEYPLYDAAFRSGLSYDVIGGKDSLTVYMAQIPGLPRFGHLVADCPAGGWADEQFVYIDNTGQPRKSPKNYNPNPIEQVV